MIGGSATTDENLYMLKLIYKPNEAHGQVQGATIYGENYKSGEKATLIAIPDDVYAFQCWMEVSNGVETQLNTDKMSQCQTRLLRSIFRIIKTRSYTLKLGRPTLLAM